jgi:hypothetical protein
MARSKTIKQIQKMTPEEREIYSLECDLENLFTSKMYHSKADHTGLDAEIKRVQGKLRELRGVKK